MADLTDPEQRLIAAARAGQPRDLAGGEPVDAEEMEGWGPDRAVRAGVLRDLLLGRHGELDPRGVRLRGARIYGVLDLDDVRTATALRLIDCHASVIRLRRAHLPALDLIGVRTTEINAENLRVDHDLNLARLRAAGAGPAGVVRLLGAHIGGQLDCSGGELTSADGPALYADGLQADGGVFLRGFRAVGAGEGGVVRLLGVRIGGNLECDGAELSSTDGPALHANGLQADGGVFLSGGFRAVGAGEGGVVRLPGARIGGQLDCTGGRTRHGGSGLDLDLYQCEVGQLLLGRGFAGRLDARGLRYGGIPDGPSVDDWLAWFRDPGPGLDYDAQPYQQLAAAHRAAGHETEARRILIAQQHDLYKRGGLSGWLRWRHRLLGVTLGYGYRSWRALAGLAATLAVAVTLAVAAGAQGIAVHTKDTATPRAHCALVEQVGLGVDLGAPLVNTGAKTRCAITTDHTTAGGILTAAGWLLQLLGFGFATLFVAGFTGIIRKG